MRDHLFISYATEDFALAEWLALRLTSEGYKVWCDRFELLGGESYPKDIDKAMKEKTFRVLALLSHNSVRKDNPVKERTMALNIGKKRGIDFLIPLNVDGLSPTELDWMMGDITYIPFHKAWAGGLSRLLKKLDSIDAPKSVENGKEIASRIYLNHLTLKHEPEQIFSNCIRVKQVPEEILEIRFREDLSSHEEKILRDRWAFYPKDSRFVFAFCPPPDSDIFQHSIVSRRDWRNEETISGIYSENIVKNLLKCSLNVKCLQKGLRSSDVGRIFFPFGLFKKDNLHFTGYTGRRTYVQVAGERHPYTYDFRYNLAPSFQIKMREEDILAEVFITFYITEISGVPLDSRKATTRHKALRKSLWNRDFLHRCIAICEYLSDENGEIVIGEDEHKVVFDARLLSFESPLRIEDSKTKEHPKMKGEEISEDDNDEFDEREDEEVDD